MMLIPLTKGFFAKVDDADFGYLMQWKWHVTTSNGGKTFYAVRNVRADEGGRGEKIYMHAVLLPEVPEVDHRNGDSLDNQRGNLRPADALKNNQNRRMRSDKLVPFKGVTQHKKGRSYFQARIKANGALHSLGYFKDPEEAARAYDAAARKFFGEFALVNFP